MPQLQIQLAGGRATFSPGDTLTGTATWELEATPQKAELHLVWHTQGKGTRDITVVQTTAFSQPQARDTRPFTIPLPDAPYTFSGQLISLIWNLELSLDPGDHCEALEITIAPGGQEVRLPRIQPTK
jgi:hypothetical protein